MEGQSGTGQSQHQYQSIQWSRLVRRNTVQALPPVPQPNLLPSLQFPPQIDILPSLLPQQPAAYQAQLDHYNKLISSGKTARIQSSPLPPVVSTQHIHATPRGSNSGPDTGKTRRNARSGHGNKNAVNSANGERSLITADDISATMSTKKLDASNQAGSRPRPQAKKSMQSQQSSSVPSTPHQHARQFSLGSREPSPDAAPNHSPRSAYSESNSILPSLRPHILRQGCKYETAMANSRRRMAYSIGSDKLEKVKASSIKARLSRDEEKKVTADMRELYSHLLPTAEGEARRTKFVQKLEKLLNDEWPGHDIRVHMFGSSGNLLCTDESDVDICITTEWKELEGVCMLAEVLAKHGMEKVICVSTAKVPIVKIWDPELRLACDMNVNNTLALENTRMIKTYVQLDERVRPLAMIIKHWTKKRIVNDAAFGGTLSSYTWICMIINFLQTRKPPVLAALHQRPHLKLPVKDGHETSFADDLDALRDFGKENKESLGELLFQFFRFYGHEMDYDRHVVSVRYGKLTTKVDKGWNLATNNRLCVEEPFNISRNLGNTTDDTSFRGLHLELRRAFDLIAEANLVDCCEEYVFPKEEERIWEKPVPQPRPTLTRSTSQSRGGRGGGYRGGRHNNHSRNGNNSRRASSASSSAFESSSTYSSHPLPQAMLSPEAWMHNQAAQERLHNDLYNTFSVLQAQENNLRLQLYTQSQVYAQAQNQVYHLSQRVQGTANQQTLDRHRGNSFDNPPLTAPLRQDMYFLPLQYQPTPIYGQHSPNAYPSSPSMSPALPELRRSLHRSTVTGSQGGSSVSSGSLRSHSQPAARSILSPLSAQVPGFHNSGTSSLVSYRQANGVTIPNFIADENIEQSVETDFPGPITESPLDGTPKEYVGYYVNEPPPPQARREPIGLPAIPAFGDIQRRRRLSTDQFPQVVLDRIRRTSRSPSPHRTFSASILSSPFKATQQLPSTSNLRAYNDRASFMVNGSGPLSMSTSSGQGSSGGEATSADTVSGEGSTYTADSQNQSSSSNTEKPLEVDRQMTRTLRVARTEERINGPPVVNGSVSRFDDRERSSSTLGSISGDNTTPTQSLATGEQPSENRRSPTKLGRTGRPPQNGGMSPLDIGTSQSEILREDFPHLSPVYEIKSPSPTTNRKFDPILDSARKESQQESQKDVHDSKPAVKLAFVNSIKESLKDGDVSKPNGHTRASKSEGSGPGSWQKIPKHKKKGQLSDKKPNPSESQALSEQIPVVVTERKGG